MTYSVYTDDDRLMITFPKLSAAVDYMKKMSIMMDMNLKLVYNIV